MSIAVTTPTGNVGSEIVRQLIRAGVRPVLLLRDPSRLGDGIAEHADVRVGDLADSAYVTEALDGVDALYLVLPEVMSADDPEALAQRMADIVRGGIESAGVRRVVFQSSVGAERRVGAGFISLLGRVEDQLDELAGRAALDVCHLRCGYFFTNLLMDTAALRAGTLTAAMPSDAPMPWVAPADIATVATGRLLSDGWVGRVVQAVHGPADVSFAQVAAIVSAVLGRAVEYTQTSDDEVREQLTGAGMSPATVESVVGMSAGLRDGFVPEQPRDLLSTTPTPLAGWAYDHLVPPDSEADAGH